VDESVVLDVGLLQTEGLLKPGSSGSLSQLLGLGPSAGLAYAISGADLQLTYTVDTEGASRSIQTMIRLLTTPAYFGGVRYWLTCPLDSSGRKLARLYLPPGAGTFGCRACLNLVYKSSLERKRQYTPINWLRR